MNKPALSAPPRHGSGTRGTERCTCPDQATDFCSFGTQFYATLVPQGAANSRSIVQRGGCRATMLATCSIRVPAEHCTLWRETWNCTMPPQVLRANEPKSELFAGSSQPNEACGAQACAMHGLQRFTGFTERA